MKVSLVHLDLGIGKITRFKIITFFSIAQIDSGGAERLVVNIAVALQALGHDVRIYTSHHDKTRCFDETKPGGHQ
jgi:alpha-1,3/alpha-1,6-mannosyltransferase